MMFASSMLLPQRPGLKIWCRAAASFAAGLPLSASGRAVRLIEITVFAILLPLIALSAPARAQTFTISSLTATPASVQPGQTTVFTATITANQSASNYPVQFSLTNPSGSNTAQTVFFPTFKGGAALTQAYGWTVPSGTSPGTYTMQVSVFNPTWSQMLASKTVALTIAAATGSGSASAPVYPTLLEFPVISGVAQVGQVLSSTTGTWTGATSFAYQWNGNQIAIAGATAATYTPTVSDVGHTLTSTVVATGSPGARSSATSAPTAAVVAASSGSSTGSTTGSISFVALHTYYMSPTGSDSNSGTSASTPWATPNHAVVCGDVIIAAAGNYSPLQSWGTVSNCPSTTGGIDGTGGVYFATVLCSGNVGTCQVNHPTGYAFGIDVNKSNWAVEGWLVSEGYASGHSGFGFTANTGTAQRHHIAFVNDIATFNASAFTTNSVGANSGAGYGLDYFAVVGDIAQNSAGRNDGFYDAAIDIIGVKNWDTTAGTHIFLSGNYSYNDQQTTGGATDGECYMFDTWDALAYSQTAVMKNNISALCERFGLQMYYQGLSAAAPIVKLYNNTFYEGSAGNYTNGTGGNFGDINIQSSTNTLPWQIAINQNIAQEPNATQHTGGNVYALVTAAYPSTVIGGSGIQNIFKGSQTKCPPGQSCDSGDNVVAFNGGNFGTNIYANPTFNNTSDLIANRMAAPSCSSFTSTTACMGYNAVTKALTNPSLIYDLVPASTYSGKGYQLPSTTCSADADYPTWLKGIVYLQWSGSSLSEAGGLITRPCNM
jgi:hypothetical protein